MKPNLPLVHWGVQDASGEQAMDDLQNFPGAWLPGCTDDLPNRTSATWHRRQSWIAKVAKILVPGCPFMVAVST